MNRRWRHGGVQAGHRAGQRSMVQASGMAALQRLATKALPGVPVQTDQSEVEPRLCYTHKREENS